MNDKQAHALTLSLPLTLAKLDKLFFKILNIVLLQTFLDLLPTTQTAGPETREFLQKVIDVLLDFVKATNDRNEKVLDFHHPEDMKRLLDLDLPDKAVNLQQLIEDCATTLKYQVKTGKFLNTPKINIILKLKSLL